MSRARIFRNAAYALAGVVIITASLWSSSARWHAELPGSRAGAAEDQTPAASVVYIVFSAQDCASDIEALARWNSLHDRGTRVQGLLYGAARPSTLHKVVAGAGLRFPVEPAPTRRLRELRSRSGYRSGSFVTVLDQADRIRMAFPLAEFDRQPTDLLIGSSAAQEKVE